MVGKRHAQTVDLKLAGIGNAAGTERILGALEPRVKFVQIHGIVHGIHARHVRDRRKLLAHVAAHALGIAVGRHQVGVGRLDFLQLNEHFVKGGVRDLGRVEHVVAIGVVIELVTQLGRTRCRLGTGIGRCSGIRVRGRSVSMSIPSPNRLDCSIAALLRSISNGYKSTTGHDRAE